MSGRLGRPWPALLLLAMLLLMASTSQAAKYRQPAYITNTYFSDKIVEDDDGVIRPLSVVKALRHRSSGVVGYLILDLMLVKRGVHRFKVDIITPRGKKISELAFAPVQHTKRGDNPIYTAAGAVSGNFAPGVWFFKVFDRVNNGNWVALATLSITIHK